MPKLFPWWGVAYTVEFGAQGKTMREELDTRRKERDELDFDHAVGKVIEVEGGYVNDPDDPGGETKWGISKRVFPNEDIFNLTQGRAKELYFDHYWVPGKCAQLPARLRLVFFDMCVLHGQYAATKVLQQALNGAGVATEVDGVLGEQTLRNATYLDPERLRSYRVLRIARIITGRPSAEKYWFGWYKRAVQV